MKNQLLTLCCVFLMACPTLMKAQQTITDSVNHGGIWRTYVLYVPANYTGTADAPLVLNYHGYTSNAIAQMAYGDFRSIADTAGFIVVHPQGTLFQGNTHWNVGGWVTGSTVDDVGFTETLIDTLRNQYSLDTCRIYSTGMSNGGFMSHLLACQLSYRIAAIASVTGSMTPTTHVSCSPSHPTPVMQIHGTADGTVPYNGDTWTLSMDDLLDYWVNYNGCDTVPFVTSLPDINTTDGCTAEHIVYGNGGNGFVTVEHFKVTNGGHTWPGAPVLIGVTNYDFNASVEIWKFFRRYSLKGTGVGFKENQHATTAIYPNPTSGTLHLKFASHDVHEVELFDFQGRSIERHILWGVQGGVDLSHLSNGMYLLRSEGQVHRVLKQ